MMTEEQYSQLRDDIKEHGQCEDVVVWKGLLLDGRNRLRACKELGIEPQIAELMEETDPVAYVISHNLHRRHLTTTQRSDVAAKLATLKRGEAGNGRKVELQFCSSTISDAASLLSVSPRSVQAASYVHDYGCQQLNDWISSGTITVSLAEKFCKEFTDKKEQAKIAKGGLKAIKEAMKKDKPKSAKDAGSAKADAAKAAKEQAKAEAAGARQKLKDDAAEAKAEAAGARQKLKDDAAEAKAEAQAAKEAAKAASLTIDGQIKNLKNLIQQHIDKAVRLVDDLAHLRPVSNATKMAVIKALQGVKLW